MNKRIGFFGLGIMGSRMAMNLVKEGHQVTVYNRTAEKCKPLENAGASVAENVAGLAEGSDIFLTMLADPEAVEEHALGKEGFLDHLKPGSLWIDFSTVNPAFTERMKNEAHNRAIRFADAPVAGTSGPAESGELIILAGGSQEDFSDMVPLFDIIGKKTVWLGETGKGTAMKMVVNLLLANAMASFAEGMSLGHALGLDSETLAAVVVGGPVAAPFLTAKNGKIRNSDYSTEFPLKHMLKDLYLATKESYYHGVAVPQTSATRELYALAVANGMGDLDFSAVYRLLDFSPKMS